MKLQVLGCHGGVSPRHLNVSFLVDERVAIEAGSLASGLELDAQGRIETVLLTHAHLDHFLELASVVDLRFQQGGPTLVVAASAPTLDALRDHVFNGTIWPDFTRIPLASGEPTMRYRTLELEERVTIHGLEVTPIAVDHTVPTCGYLVDDGSSAIAYSGDTGPTSRLWQVLSEVERLRAVITEVSFPDREEEIARVSQHMTPARLRAELEKMGASDGPPVYVYGVKPQFEAEILAELEGLGNPRVRVLVMGETLEL